MIYLIISLLAEHWTNEVKFVSRFADGHESARLPLCAKELMVSA